MAIALQAFLFLGGLAVAIVASGRAVDYTRALASALGAPSFVVGVVLVSIGTDLPEIANSIVAHVEGEGDVNVGDSVGSVLTQYTLVLALFPLVMRVVPIERGQAAVVSLMTMAGLALTILFVADGFLSRGEGFLLVSAWAFFTWIVVKTVPGHAHDEPPEVRFRGHLKQTGIVLLALCFVGFGATVAVRALVEMAAIAGVPEFAIAFFGASIGTSAPEIFVDLTALAKGAPGIAIGDALGSSLVDSTLSIGIGPLVAPASVTARLAVIGSLYALAAVAVVGATLALRRRHDRRSGMVFFAIYLLAYVVIIQAV